MITLTFLQRFDIADEAAGLLEPSGLALAEGGQGLWTVSDDTKRIFRLDLDGKVLPDQSFDLPGEDLEGITADATGRLLLAVREADNEIVTLDLGDPDQIETHPLADMAGHGTVAHLIDLGGKNKRLEGIAWNGDTGSYFLLKEGEPGLLVEVSEDLGTILGHALLDRRNGFLDPDKPDKPVDFSGICHDPVHSLLWIVSDRARRLYLYDLGRSRVVQSLPLSFVEQGEPRRIEKAEGLAYDAKQGRLYVVSDREARLYVYDVKP